MRIVDVRARSLRSPDRDRRDARPFGSSHWYLEPVSLVVVEVVTDEGLTGVGTVGGFCEAAEPIIQHHYRDVLVGEDPRDVERHWRTLYRVAARYGRRGAAIEALSGVDIALWDVLAKSLGVPVYRLLGGRTKARVPVYASHLRDGWGPDRLAEVAAQDAEQGFRAVKLFVTTGPADGRRGMAALEEAVRAIREAVGPDVEIMVDPHMRWTVDYALQMGRRLTPYGLRWLEEPLPADDIAGYARLNAALDISIATGEHEYTRFAFAELIAAKAARVLQPDVNRVGGITEARKICALADAHHLEVCFHQGWLHSYHLVLSQTNCQIAEYFPRPTDEPPGNAMIWRVLQGEPEAHDGAVDVPEAPGFGWTIDEEAMQRYAWRG